MSAAASFMTLGSQMVQVWQQSMEAWWQGLLGDQQRLGQLADQLAALGLTGGARPVEQDRLIKALELMERRLEKLDRDVAALASGLEALAGRTLVDDPAATGRGQATIGGVL